MDHPAHEDYKQAFKQDGNVFGRQIFQGFYRLDEYSRKPPKYQQKADNAIIV